ncbi:low-specificity L-threonine aldolase [Tindallia californiensis]|uniref:L-threonine aldolase n=1 Tax=Tindallia californiensis TaxID=159292 RepID=A0A1H3NHV3_9FIRM|nr:low-specificity L-threonine aldolase [Tindallia californiensis]SDY87809.1 L-threonine aldolase [Tindallia californiensis]
MKTIDLRSDTVTKPTPEMLVAMSSAPLGDDVYGDDPTVNELEKLAADKLGKEAALLVPTGTMGNLIAVMAHTSPGQEIILEANSHIYLYEVAGIARIAGVQARTIHGNRGEMLATDIEKSIRSDNIHFPETGLICLENTHNMAGGRVISLENMQEVQTIGQKHGLPLHLDGARIFNAAISLNKDVRKIAESVDSVMFCLSKGLSSPVGSMLVGSSGFIKKSRKLRKMLGGGMRQAGIIAACGIISLNEMTEQLKIDHRNAAVLVESLYETGHFDVSIDNTHTNIVNARIAVEGWTAFELVDAMEKKGVLTNARNEEMIRFVTHKDVSMEEIEEAVIRISQILKS